MTRHSAASGPLSVVLLVLTLALATALSSSGSAASVGDPPGIEEVSAEIDATVSTYVGEECYRLHFSQENYWALADTSVVTGAVLTSKRPRSLSIRYDDGGRIVAAGGTLRVFIPQTNQFFISRVDSTSLIIDPASILMSYRLHPDEPVTAWDARHLSVRLVPEGRFMSPSRVDVTIDRTTHLVIRLSADATSGDSSTYVIEKTELGISVPDSEFRLAPPPGVSIQSGSPYDYGEVGS